MPARKRKFTPPVPDAARVRARDLRAHLKEHLAGAVPLIVGSAWRPRAIVLPVRESWERGPQAHRVRDAHLRALLESALRELNRW
jgi:hypothetical protein